MNLIELSNYLQNEEAAREYLLEQGILKRFTNCPYCNSEKIGNIRRDRMKCYKCKKEWHRRKGSFLESRHISYTKFVGFLKLYSDDFGFILLSNELEIDYKTIRLLFSDIFMVLFPSHNFKSEGSLSKVIIFTEENKIKIKFLNKSESFYETESYIFLEIQRYKEVGGIYSFLIKSSWVGRKSRAFSTLDRFLSFVKMKLISYRGINSNDFYYYLLLLGIKYNIEESNFYEYLIQKLRVAETPTSSKNED